MTGNLRQKGAVTKTILKIASLFVLLAGASVVALAEPPQKQTTKSPHGPLAIPCENCHTATAWKPIRAVPEFDHNKTRYPLRGMHEKVECTQCHVKPIFTDVGKNCEDCHADVHQRRMGTNCAQCHTVQGWNIAVQQVKDHQNRFPLLGAHAALQCEDCHKDAAVGQFLGLSTACITCHQNDLQRTQNIGGNVPNHISANFPVTCQTCHTFDSWVGATFNHDTTGFLLRDSHQLTPIGKVNACTDCHLGGNYSLKIAQMDCGNPQCHLSTNYGGGWQGTTNPKHAAAPSVFPVANCSTCHNTISFLTANFDHSTTGFPLQNSHQMAPIGKVNACTDCHLSNNYNLTTQLTDCGNSQCHLNTNYGGGWQGTTNPNHAAAPTVFPVATCSTCHTTVSFLTATFDHSTTGFPLQNSHQMAPAGKVNNCTDCHTNNNYNLTTQLTDCGNSSCHLSTNYGGGWQGATNPNHSAAPTVFPVASCSTCHTTVSFLTATFDHSTTGFPLTNAHQMAPAGKVNNCTDCHISNDYNLGPEGIGPTSCGDAKCHLNTNYGGGWQGATNPNHSAAPTVFPVATCSTCHNTVSFLTATFDHSTTGFPLQNSHQMAPAGKVNNCTDCHINNDYNLQAEGIGPTSCGDAKCHMTTNYGGGWQGTNSPPHAAAPTAFPVANCSTCHNTVSFLTSTFDHTTTGFALTNSHQTAPAGKINACTDCHVANDYNLQAEGIGPTSCGDAKCHLSTNYGGGWQGTNNPPHAAAPTTFPVATCSTCHNTTSFLTATFDHTTTGFPLQNSHQMAPAGKVNNCTDCHIANDYNLQAEGIGPTSCGDAKCHLSTNYGGGWQGTNNPSHSAAPASFPLAACSTCHNTTSFLTSTFDHSTTGFPLQNSHQIAPAGLVTGCDQCHSGNYSTLAILPTDCGNSSCHLTKFYGGGWQGTNSPPHAAAATAFPVASCSTCHTTTSFLTSTFDHTTTGFALTNSHQTAPAGKINACTDCHIANDYNLQAEGIGPTSCGDAKCHLSTNYGGGWQGTTNPSHSAAPTTFPVATCSTCHNTTSFLTATFDHTTTGFPLTNAHQTAPAGKINACTDCHIANDYNLQAEGIGPTSCGNAKCHLSTNYGGGWQGTNNPVHSSAGPTFVAANCSTCHNTTTFLTATFDHSTTGFALTGAHQMAPAGKANACTDCHTNSNYTTGFPPMDCGNSGCHLKDWNNTPTFGGNVPNHITGGYPILMCSTCHDTVLWTDGKFDHSTTGFALQGPHMLPPRTTVTGAVGAMVNMCTDCHTAGNYTTGFPTTDCYSCHTTYFTNAQTYGTSVPNHVSAAYPTTCTSCHTTYVTQAWLGAVFNHTYFRIPHHTTTSVCADCHTNAANYKIFSCENCHSVPTAHQPGMSHPNVCSPSPACWYTPNTRCYDCHKG